MIKTAGKTIRIFALNFDFIVTSCVLVAAIVVSEMNERLSPNIAPPTTIPQSKATFESVLVATSIAIGANAATVPIEVPIAKLNKQAIRKIPGRIILDGKILNPRFETESTACIALATP